jgi:pimeloyl-ACP methyl ester carboxylesterase
VNGVTQNYATGGTGPAVILLHGYPQTWYMWRKVMPALAEQYTVIAPDLRGSGRSDAPATGLEDPIMAPDDTTAMGGRSPVSGLPVGAPS